MERADVSPSTSVVREAGIDAMNSRSDTIELRGWITLGFCFAALAVPMALNSLGMADFDSERSAADPYRPADRSFASRVCLVSEWMSPACLLAWACAQFRAKQAMLFSNDVSCRGALAAGIGGLAILTVGWLRWNARPFSGEHFGAFDGWLFGLGWFLVWWSLVFWKGKASGKG